MAMLAAKHANALRSFMMCLPFARNFRDSHHDLALYNSDNRRVRAGAQERAVLLSEFSESAGRGRAIAGTSQLMAQVRLDKRFNGLYMFWPGLGLN
jgi:hypothetical protein